jgi:hypothetical protein
MAFLFSKRFITVFILFNVIAILIGSTAPPAQQNPFQRFVLPYLRWTRLLQSWPLFVPAPRKYAMKYRVEVQFQDGSTQTWRRPYPPNWDFFARHLAYNFQKWDLAANYLESNDNLRLDLAHYVERIYCPGDGLTNATNPCQTIRLIRSNANWPPPKESGWVGGEESDLHWIDRTLFVYNVKEKRLQ